MLKCLIIGYSLHCFIVRSMYVHIWNIIGFSIKSILELAIIGYNPIVGGYDRYILWYINSLGAKYQSYHRNLYPNAPIPRCKQTPKNHSKYSLSLGVWSCRDRIDTKSINHDNSLYSYFCLVAEPLKHI